MYFLILAKVFIYLFYANVTGETPAADMSSSQQFTVDQRDGRLVRLGRSRESLDRRRAGRCAGAAVRRAHGGRSRRRPRRVPAPHPRHRPSDPLRRVRRSAQHLQHHQRTGTAIRHRDIIIIIITAWTAWTVLPQECSQTTAPQSYE